MGPFLFRIGVHLLAQGAELAHALDGVVDLARLHVLQLVDVEALGLVSFREKNEGHSAVLATGWIQLEARQPLQARLYEQCKGGGVVATPHGVLPRDSH